MTKIKGNMLCDEKYMNNPDLLLEIISESIQMLWKVDIHNCPISASLLEVRLKRARYNVEHNLVNINDVEPDTFGPNAFKDPFELLSWLENNKPQQDIVLTHGDFCLPNVFAMENLNFSKKIYLLLSALEVSLCLLSKYPPSSR